MDEYLELARAAIIAQCLGKFQQFSLPEFVSEELIDQQAGCFVSIWNQDESLRGCIGTISPLQPNLALEIAANASAAASKDPRFAPVQLNELEYLGLTVDIMDEPEEIDSITSLDSEQYGVIIEKGSKLGLMLPNMPGITSIQKQIEEAMRKAEILDGLYGCTLYRFTVERHTEAE